MTQAMRRVDLPFTDGDIPSKLLSFRDWLDDKIATIPEAARAAATVELDVQYSYGDSAYGELNIGYCVPKTQEEIDEAARVAAEAKARQIAYLKSQLGKLEGEL